MPLQPQWFPNPHWNRGIRIWLNYSCVEMIHWSFLFKYSMVAAWWQCWWHSRHSEARTGTWILQKPEQRYLCFSWINQDHIYQIRNNWLGPIFFSPGDTFTKGILVLLHPSFDHVIDMTQIQKGRFVFLKVAPSNDRVFCIYAPSGHGNREQLARRRFFEGLQT